MRSGSRELVVVWLCYVVSNSGWGDVRNEGRSLSVVGDFSVVGVVSVLVGSQWLPWKGTRVAGVCLLQEGVVSLV